MKKVQLKIRKEEIFHSKFGYGFVVGKRGNEFLCEFNKLIENNQYNGSLRCIKIREIVKKEDFEKVKNGFGIKTKIHFQTGTFFSPNGFNLDGFDLEGYNQEGFNGNGFDRKGFDISGYNEGGFDIKGYNKKGYNKEGYNTSGYNKLGFDKNGFDDNGYNKNGFDFKGYNKEGYNKEGYDTSGYNKLGFDKNGFDDNGYNKNGFDYKGYNKNGFNHDGIGENGTNFNYLGYDKDGYDKNGYNHFGIDKYNKNKEENKLLEKLKQFKTIIQDGEWQAGQDYLTSNGINSNDSEVIKIKNNKLQTYLDKNSDIYKNPPSDEQKRFLIDFAQRILLQARAGSGKTTTLVQKTHFLLNECKIQKEEIIFLAFNKSAVKDVNEKFESQRLENAMTFHSLAGRIGSYEDEITVVEQSENEQDKDFNLKNASRHVIQEMLQDDTIKKLVYEIFKSDKGGEESSPKYEEFINNKGLSSKEYYEIVRGKDYQTLDNEIVKSKAEKWIGDFLFEHDIRYSYEWTEQWQNKKKNIRGYSPDFRLDSFLVEGNFLRKIYPKKVWIEFWGIDEFDPDKEINPDWDTTWEKYQEEMMWKRKYWKEKPGNLLIEFSVADIDYHNPLARELFERKIKETLEKNGIACKKLSEKELTSRVVENFKTGLEEMVEQFINRCKQRKWSPSDVTEIHITNALFHEGKIGMFYDFANQCYSRYEEKLRKTGKKDFNDILIDATKKVHKEKGDISVKISKKFSLNTNLKTIQYLMIDEYQDFSQLYYELVSTIAEYNPHLKIICVGDNWQLINSFSGSETKFYEEYESLFSGGKRLDLLKTWRCPLEIVGISNRLMLGLGKGTVCGKGHHGKIEGKYLGEIFIECRKEEILEYNKEGIFFTDEERGELKKARYLKYCCEKILEHQKQDKETNREQKTSFLIMSPFNKTPFLKNELINSYILLLERDYEINNSDEVRESLNENLIMQTVHKSKGAEADVCILLQVGKKEDRGNTKFPFLHPDYQFGRIFGDTTTSILEEQRRLFYVALTRTKTNLYFISEAEFTQLSADFLISSFNDGHNEYIRKSGGF